jgi:hypothetical protein
MRIGVKIKTWRATLDPGDGQLLDGIEADRTEPDRLADGAGDQILLEDTSIRRRIPAFAGTGSG